MSCSFKSLYPFTETPLVFRYVYAKSTPSGLTEFHALYLNSTSQSVQFQYHPEGLQSGYNTLNVAGVNIADGSFHHVAVSVYGNSFALFVDGLLLGQRYTLNAPVEDGVGVFYLGRTVAISPLFSGTVMNIIVSV